MGTKVGDVVGVEDKLLEGQEVCDRSDIGDPITGDIQDVEGIEGFQGIEVRKYVRRNLQNSSWGSPVELADPIIKRDRCRAARSGYSKS